jgi:hypothetical protein
MEGMTPQKTAQQLNAVPGDSPDLQLGLALLNAHTCSSISSTGEEMEGRNCTFTEHLLHAKPVCTGSASVLVPFYRGAN